jgi:hypothetical protein
MKKVFNTKPAMTSIDPMKVYYNIGALMDIPTGQYVRGERGENILNGGVGALTAVVGKPNMFKSTIAHYMTLSASAKISSSGYAPFINTYDTESNMLPERLLFFSKTFKEFKDIDILNEGIWQITDVDKHLGDEWYKLLKDYLKDDKLKNAKQYTFKTPFIDKNNTPISVLFPTFGQVDSLSKFLTADVEAMQNKNQLGESGGNTIYMRQGLAKARMLMELPGLCNATAHYLIVTAHVGKNTTMMQAGGAQIPVKQLQHMKSDEAIKGAPSDFFFLTNTLWQAISASNYYNQGTKGPEYPRLQSDPEEGSADLNKVSLKLLRNKSGPSGHTVELMVSQRDGVLPSLSEFHFIKENDRFGLEGNNTTYSLTLFPGVKIMRTTVRELLDSNEKLRRAVKITADLLQIQMVYRTLPLKVPPLADLYKKLDEQYGWDTILNTRDYWTFNQYDHEIPFLSSLDILEMYYDKYVPWWAKKPEMKGSAK